MNQAQSVPYIIKGSLPDRYPRGWFCVGAGYEFTNQPRRMNYFDTSLVGYRGDDGEVHILDAFCPHMGANLGDGQVVGNSVVCPFHAWSWGADGVCDNIPYAKKIPPKAVIKSWSTMEENELVYMWHDPDGGEPIEAQKIPRKDWVDGDFNYSPWIIDRVEVPSNCRELIDNMADVAHFEVVHGAPEAPDYFSNVVENHIYTQHMHANVDGGKMKSEATYYGPGYMMHSNAFYDNDDKLVERWMSLVMNVPTGMGSFEFLAGFKYPMPDHIQGGIENSEVRAFMDEKLQEQKDSSGVYADLAIWLNKCTIDNPVLCDGDGPVNRLRQWYNQFLVPVDQVPEILSERKVYQKAFDA